MQMSTTLKCHNTWGSAIWKHTRRWGKTVSSSVVSAEFDLQVSPLLSTVILQNKILLFFFLMKGKLNFPGCPVWWARRRTGWAEGLVNISLFIMKTSGYVVKGCLCRFSVLQARRSASSKSKATGPAFWEMSSRPTASPVAFQSLLGDKGSNLISQALYLSTLSNQLICQSFCVK